MLSQHKISTADELLRVLQFAGFVGHAQQPLVHSYTTKEQVALSQKKRLAQLHSPLFPAVSYPHVDY